MPTYLAEPDLIVERAHGLLDRGRRVAHVEPEQIDVLGAEATEALLQRPHEALPVITARIGVSPVDGERVLRRDHPALALLLGELAHERLARAVGVVVRGVDEIAACVVVAVKDPPALVRIGPPAPVGAEGHRAESQLADAQAASAEELVPQDPPPHSYCCSIIIETIR